MKVYVLDPIHPKAMDELARKVEAVGWGDPEVGRWPEDADGVIVRVARIGEAELGRAKPLRVIGKHGVGVDNIDLEAARRAGVRVVNTPGVNVEAVAELTVGLTLAVARKIALADRRLRHGGLSGLRDQFQGVELWGKRLGVVGLGNIGRRVAELFNRAFGMAVVGCDPHLPEERWKSLEAELGLRRAASLAELLSAADLVTVHVPLTPETRGLIGERELRCMRPSAILVNTARGGVCEEKALYRALCEGWIAGAASDVFEHEPPGPDHPLLKLDSFVATPHIGALTEETMERTGRAVVRAVLDVLAGRPARSVVV